ncbi:hypothetical protein L195_g064555 [Trifolium pratense]|uniref:Uncharacterized protein n=1 Tax=Trifolium pratense TaxID=57577 RepID=A0A2K3KTV1_TRIPR|nr:hypothetical protein L195_g064555 [Trifolium pratense]
MSVILHLQVGSGGDSDQVCYGRPADDALIEAEAVHDQEFDPD